MFEFLKSLIFFAIFELLVVTIPPSPDVMDFNGCNEKVEISECLQQPILNVFFLYLYSDPRA